MRIGMLLDVYKPHVSGVTNYVALNKRVLEDQGQRVFVFTFGEPGYRDDELHVVRSPGLALTVKDTGLHLNLRYSGAAQRKLRSMDVIHVQHPFVSGQLALRYARASGLPIVFTSHTRYDLYAQHYLPGFIPAAVSQTFLQAYLAGFCQQCDLVIAPSPGAAAVLRGMDVSAEIKVIPNGVDLAPFQAPPDRRSRVRLGLPVESVLFMYLGRLGPEKNLAFLLRAFTELATARPDVALALVGDGPEADNLRDQARKAGVAARVSFLGQVPYADVPGYLRLADVFVTASQTEVHPLSLIEALAAGLPAVGIRSPGVGDTIVDGQNGCLSGPNLDEFVAQMLRLATQPAWRHSLAEMARASAVRYDIRQTAVLLLAEYERLVRLKPRQIRKPHSLLARSWLP